MEGGLDIHTKRFLLENLETAHVAKVTAVAKYQNKQVVDLQVSTRYLHEDGESVKFPYLQDVPVVLPSGGGASITFPVAVGDTVLVVFCKQSIARFLAGNIEPHDTEDRMLFGNNNAVCFPSLYPERNTVKPHPDNFELKFKDFIISVDPDSNILIKTSSNLTVEVGGDLNATVTGSANITADGITLNSSSDIDITASGDVNITGSQINLN